VGPHDVPHPGSGGVPGRKPPSIQRNGGHLRASPTEGDVETLPGEGVTPPPTLSDASWWVTPHPGWGHGRGTGRARVVSKGGGRWDALKGWHCCGRGGTSVGWICYGVAVSWSMGQGDTAMG